MAYLSDSVFRTVLEATPLVSIDLCLCRKGRYLLGWRNNRPAARHWFVPGGRIQKNETIANAFRRITETELGQPFDLTAARLLGAYDHIYTDTVFADTPFGTHYVVIGHHLDLPDDFEPELDAQHSEWRWASPDEILADDSVHENTKAYFRT
jgi:colanic acid biosynthesis protein WcaH